MANSTIAVTEGSGKNVAGYSFSEDATTKQLQRVVLNDSSGVEAGAWAFDVAVTPTVTNGAYSAGDIVGALLTFSSVARAADELFIITGAQVMVKAAVTSSLNLVIFNADPTSTTKTDNAAYSLNAADAFKVVKTIPVSTLYDHGTPNSYSADGLFIPTTPVSGSRNIYGLLIDGTGWTLTSTGDIQVRLRGVGR